MELEDIMPNGISQTEKRNTILKTKKKVKTDSQKRKQMGGRQKGESMVGGGVGKQKRTKQLKEINRHKSPVINKSQGCNTQHRDYGQ